MYIENIEISGFRNLKSKKIFSFENNKNIIFGPNGSGKTSVLEAIYILGFGRSFLNVKKNDMLNNGSNEFFISSSIIRSKYGFNISAAFNKKFSLFLDGEKTGIAGIGKNLFPLFFSSSDYVSLISSRSGLRRLFDKFIFGIDVLYSNELIEYKKIIHNKSSLLKQNPTISHLRGWNKLLGERIFSIIKKRDDFIGEINTRLKRDRSLDLKIKYNKSAPEFENRRDLSLDLIMSVLDKILGKELIYKTPLVGTHLDRYEITIDDRPLKLFSSGEKKINLLFIYLAYIDMFLSSRGEYPVFLVDDYDIAMDEKNTELLISNYPEMQIIATSVRKNKNFETILKLKN